MVFQLIIKALMVTPQGAILLHRGQATHLNHDADRRRSYDGIHHSHRQQDADSHHNRCFQQDLN
jgi:hypothetical protein